MINLVKSLFSGGGAIESIATEWIETEKETAEARAIMIKTLDPNGKMRRDLSRFSCLAYAFYLIAMVSMAFMATFEVGNSEAAKEMMKLLSDMFLPVTTAWGAIVSASFGVNAANSIKGK